jgi:crossover junction endodeoxyribonuclease RuvC
MCKRSIPTPISLPRFLKLLVERTRGAGLRVKPASVERRILGIDPGSRITGYGVIDSDGMRSRHVASGCITAADSPWPQRLGIIFNGVAEVVRAYVPDQLAIEQVFFARNAASSLKLGQARGAAICGALCAGLEIHEYAPRAVKQAVVGSGGAEKSQVGHMVRIILALTDALKEDQADALAVAICHAHTQGVAQKTSWRTWRQ